MIVLYWYWLSFSEPYALVQPGLFEVSLEQRGVLANLQWGRLINNIALNIVNANAL